MVELRRKLPILEPRSAPLLWPSRRVMPWSDHGFMSDSRELWSVRDIADWLGLTMPAAYALVAEPEFPLPVRGQAHSRRWSQTVVRAWITTPRFAEPSAPRPQLSVVTPTTPLSLDSLTVRVKGPQRPRKAS